MPENLPERPRLLMVTDTFLRFEEGEWKGFEPVVREVEALAHLFSSILWIGTDYGNQKTPATLATINAGNVTPIAIRGGRGNRMIDKILAIKLGLSFIPLFFKLARKHEIIHTRAPSVPSFLAVACSPFFRSQTYWNKYAGNWAQSPAPPFDAIQRAAFKRIQKNIVTIKGRWPNQPRHCLSFENPCLDKKERELGNALIQEKDYTKSIKLCFTGRLETEKGVGRIIDALKELGGNTRISCIHFIGDGPERHKFEDLARDLMCRTYFHGFLPRKEVAAVFAECHIFLLPTTASEGFPKVIAEAANYGCIPLVSNISSIGQYVNEHNGFIINSRDCEGPKLASKLAEVLSDTDLKQKAIAAHEMAAPFTFEHYNQKIQSVIIEHNPSRSNS